jgi:hypothetical protein
MYGRLPSAMLVGMAGAGVHRSRGEDLAPGHYLSPLAPAVAPQGVGQGPKGGPVLYLGSNSFV